MIQTVEAVINEQGVARLLQPVRVSAARRALVTILEETPALTGDDAAGADAPISMEEWGVPCNNEALLLRETAAWEAASAKDALKIEKMLAETN